MDVLACFLASETKNEKIMSDVDFLRMAALYLLPKCMDRSIDPVKHAVDYAEELLKECQKRENL